MSTLTTSQELYDLLATHNWDIEVKKPGDQDATTDDADIFKFDFVVDDKNYGTAVITLTGNNELLFYFGDNLGKGMEAQDREAYFDFLDQLRMFAKSHRMTFEPDNINRLKYTLKGMSAIKEGLFESYYGNRKVSYAGSPTEARLMIKHNRTLGENDARYRYVESLFIETQDGERYKLPFTNLAGGRAMLEHVRQGGKPYDVRGQHIVEMINDSKVLTRFNRARNSKIFEGETSELVEATQVYYESLRANIKRLASPKGYQTYFESWQPNQICQEDNLIDNLKQMFIEQTLDERIEDALPIIARVRQFQDEMKESHIFENFLESVSQGTLVLPETPQQKETLKKLMSQELRAGPDGINATEQLYGVLEDEQLYDIISDIAITDADADVWADTRIQDRMAELGYPITSQNDNITRN